MAAHAGSKKVIYAALAGNLLIAVTKFGAALFTGSSAMLQRRRAFAGRHRQWAAAALWHEPRRPAAPTARHPLGHGRELYFWSFIVALLVFALGAGVSLLRRHHAHHAQPEPVENPLVNYIVLGLSFLFEGSSWMVALREFRRTKGKLGYFAGRAAEQGSKRLHRAVRGQRRAARPGDRLRRHPRRAAARRCPSSTAPPRSASAWCLAQRPPSSRARARAC